LYKAILKMIEMRISGRHQVSFDMGQRMMQLASFPRPVGALWMVRLFGAPIWRPGWQLTLIVLLRDYHNSVPPVVLATTDKVLLLLLLQMTVATLRGPLLHHHHLSHLLE
jgi:hypothetical protein